MRASWADCGGEVTSRLRGPLALLAGEVVWGDPMANPDSSSRRLDKNSSGGSGRTPAPTAPAGGRSPADAIGLFG